MFKSKLLTGLIAVVALAAIGAGAAYFLLIRDTSPDEVSIESALEKIGSTSQASNSQAMGQDSSLVGTWAVVPGATSFVGYRVNETLAGLGAVTAVGRTQSVQGTLAYDGKAITKVDLTADLRTLTSDRSLRDGQLRTQALETNTFPTATFALSSAIAIDSVPADGQKLTKSVQGQLTLHGVTKPIQMDIEGVIQNGQVVLVGSTEIKFADYNIAQPRAGAVLSIEDKGIMEFQLVFAKQA